MLCSPVHQMYPDATAATDQLLSICISIQFALSLSHASRQFALSIEHPFNPLRLPVLGAPPRAGPLTSAGNGGCGKEFSGRTQTRATGQSSLRMERRRATELAFHP